MRLEDWARSQHRAHVQAAKDAGLTPLRSFHNGYAAAMLVQLGDGGAAMKVAEFIVAGGSQGARGLAGFRQGFAHAEGVATYIDLLDASTADAWQADAKGEPERAAG